jgi:glycosyltransferase involved in cell wall biosynthesis
MACYNRKKQLSITLKSLLLSKHKNFELIIVDDVSDPNECINDLVLEYRTKHNMNIKLFRVTKELKTYINPCVPYNIALSQVDPKTDIVIVQNPEVCHVGDILSYVSEKLQSNDYMTFSCYGLANMQDNYSIDSFFTSSIGETIISNNPNNPNNPIKTITPNNPNNPIKTIKQFIASKPNKSGGTYFHTSDPSGWLNHITQFRPYHYLCAMFKSDMDKHGGFDDDYADGLCFDDDDFVKRVAYCGFRATFPRYENNENPFCIHLWHPKIKQLDLGREKWNINNVVFKRKMTALGLSEQRGGVLKPYLIN